jgi:pyrimidine-nucleoside phosphorylase
LSDVRAVDLIARKRDGGELTGAELRAMLDPRVPDYQVAAFLMAAVLRGLSETETAELMWAMVESGERLDLSGVGRPVADKHSTGGVGDKTTLVAAPIAAACGVPVAKLAGRGLGHTGGTLDKLAAIPGMRTDLVPAEIVAIARDAGVAVGGQTASIVPADGRLYALRDATATVRSVPLIATSIMAKKVAAGAARVVLDVKVGEGALLPDLDAARQLAGAMLRLGAAAGLETTCVLTRMDEPLGHAVGNALEVGEAEATLRDEGPADLAELSLTVAGAMTGDRAAAEAALASGAAHAAFRRWIAAQGGDLDAGLPAAPLVQAVAAPRAGWVRCCHARAVGEAAMALGAGRSRKEQDVDLAVGIVCHRKAGDRVEAGEPLATVHARRPFDAGAVARCFEIADEACERAPTVIEVLGA